MKKIIKLIIILIIPINFSYAKDNLSKVDNLFYIDQMNSYDENFALYFKTREKAILARGESSNYINDFPKDLYIYNYQTKESSPLISYEWFPKRAKYFLKEYDFPVFPDDFAYYLLNDNKTLIMISATKNLKANFKFDIFERKLELYPVNGKFEFIISSIAKSCGYNEFKENYKCFRHTALYISLPPISSTSLLLTIRFVNGPWVPSMHSIHIADNLNTLSARGMHSNISPIFSCL